MSISNYLELKLLDHVLRAVAFAAPAAVYVSLHTADSGETGASEVAGGSYARKLAAFGAAVAGESSTTAVLTWTAMPAATVTHIGIWDALSAGNFLWGGPLSSPKTTASGDSVEIAAGDLDVTLD